jgi:transcriptional regulator with XRE-family HTH domain
MNIADRIQNLRKTKGISQEELADKIGVSRQAISKWESEQSTPEIDKVIIMSEFFDVTTDYILKGIENSKQTNERILDANVFVIVATVLDFIGLIVACAVWYQEQVPMALVIGLVFMALGCMIFGIGQVNSTRNAEKARRTFWSVNIWLLSFIPLSFVYNTVFARSNAPYPLLGFPRISFPIFWLVYISACLCVVYAQVKIGLRGGKR